MTGRTCGMGVQCNPSAPPGQGRASAQIHHLMSDGAVGEVKRSRRVSFEGMFGVARFAMLGLAPCTERFPKERAVRSLWSRFGTMETDHIQPPSPRFRPEPPTLWLLLLALSTLFLCSIDKGYGYRVGSLGWNR